MKLLFYINCWYFRNIRMNRERPSSVLYFAHLLFFFHSRQKNKIPSHVNELICVAANTLLRIIKFPPHHPKNEAPLALMFQQCCIGCSDRVAAQGVDIVRGQYIVQLLFQCCIGCSVAIVPWCVAQGEDIVGMLHRV